MEKTYDAVIIGGGVHGLATAYYLARNHAMTNIAVVEKSYVGSGGSGRNTAIVRSNYLTPEGSRFYNRSVDLYEQLAVDLNFNVMFEQRGHMTLAHDDASLRTMHWRAEVNKHEGIDSRVIEPAEIHRLAPYIDVSSHPRYPIPRCALAPARRHRSPRRRGVGVCQGCRISRCPHPPRHRDDRHHSQECRRCRC